MSQLFDTYMGLVALGLILYFIFNDSPTTVKIIHGATGVGGGFIDNLEGRSSVYPGSG